MTGTPDISGVCPVRFAAVRDAFARNFENGGELGAGFAACIDGEVVIDLWAGHADRRRERLWTAGTLSPVFSTTKAIASVVFARAVGEGRIDYAAPVTDLWPAFGQAGKDTLSIEQLLSHQAGLAGFAEPIDAELWFDWDALCAALAAATPLWPPGSASGYHPQTWGYLAGEIYRRATGRTISQALREDFAIPLGLDLWIGLPDVEHARAAEQVKPNGPALLGEITPIKRAAFLQPWSSPRGKTSADWRRVQNPSANGHATAVSLARLMSALACDGRLDGTEVLARGVAAEAARARICGQDLVIPHALCWGAGLLRNDPVKVYGPGKNTVGHSGWGGSCAMADPDRRLSAAYVMNKQSVHLIGDPRPMRLLAALYGAL